MATEMSPVYVMDFSICASAKRRGTKPEILLPFMTISVSGVN
jgi:hypothetical protein